MKTSENKNSKIEAIKVEKIIRTEMVNHLLNTPRSSFEAAMKSLVKENKFSETLDYSIFISSLERYVSVRKHQMEKIIYMENNEDERANCDDAFYVFEG
jgi:hypothetical protein